MSSVVSGRPVSAARARNSSSVGGFFSVIPSSRAQACNRHAALKRPLRREVANHSHIASKALSARVIAGGEGGDPRLRGEGEVGCGVYERKHLAPTKHHLTLPLLRNGPHPLPRCAAERDHERRRRGPLSPIPAAAYRLGLALACSGPKRPPGGVEQWSMECSSVLAPPWSGSVFSQRLQCLPSPRALCVSA